MMRPEPYVKHIQMEKADILIIAFLWLCLTAFFLSNVDLNVRYIPFNTSLNTLNVSTKVKNNDSFHFLLLFLLFLMIFDFVSVLFLAQEYCNNLDIRNVRKTSVVFVKMLHYAFASITMGAFYMFWFLKHRLFLAVSF